MKERYQNTEQAGKKKAKELMKEYEEVVKELI